MKIFLLVLLLTLQGCTLWDIIKPKPGGISVETEIVAGDKEEQINSEVVGKKEVTTNTADSIVQTYNIANREYPFWVVALLILGWVLPTPSQIIKNISSWRPYGKKG